MTEGKFQFYRPDLRFSWRDFGLGFELEIGRRAIWLDIFFLFCRLQLKWERLP